MDFKKMMKNKNIQILTYSAAANIILVWLILQSFDLVSSLAYVAIAVGVGYSVKSNKLKATHLMFMGALVSVLYHGGSHLLGFFDVSGYTLISSAIQQGLITLGLAKLWGVK